MKISSLDKDVENVLTSNYFRVPRFQRPYSWDRGNVDEFFKDSIVEATEDYFIGSVVFYKDNRDTFGIVDGQQRLTTITILLAVIRNAFAANGHENLALGLQALIERPDRSNQLQFVLQTETSYPYFQEYIQKHGHPDDQPEIGPEEIRLEDAFRYLSEQILEMVQAFESDPTLRKDVKARRIEQRLCDIRDRILRLKLIVIELDNEDDAYIIFETLNTRGKDLTVGDLVKNHLTKLLRRHNRNVDRPKEKWNKILESFDASQADLDINRFLHHSWLSRYEYTTEKRLYKSLKKTVTAANAKSFLDALISDADLYRQIHEPATRKWKAEEMDLRNSLEALSLFGVKQQLPFVLTLLRDLSARRLSLKQVRDSLWTLEAFYFLYTAVTSQRPSGGFGMMFARFGRELAAAPDAQGKANVIGSIKAKLTEMKPDYSQFRVSFGMIRYSDIFTRQKKLVQYILKKIVLFYSPHTPLDFSKLTIEHIASQSAAGTGGITEASIAELGNLVLIQNEVNTELLKNKPFLKKKPLLVTHGLYPDATIVNSTQWSGSEILQRTEELGKTSYDSIWRW